MPLLGIGTNKKPAAPNQVLPTAEVLAEHDADNELKEIHAAAAEINVFEGVWESLQYGTWRTVALVRGLEECKSRMLLQWQTTGVVSVLLASLLMSLVVDPPYGSDMDSGQDSRVRAFGLMAFISLLLNLACILLAYILVIEVDQVVSDVDFSEFIVRFQHFDEVLKSMFTLSCLCLLGAVVMSLHIRYDMVDMLTDFWICLGFMFVVFAIVAYCATVMDMFTKARLSVARLRTNTAEVDLVKATAKSAVDRAKQEGALSDGASYHSGAGVQRGSGARAAASVTSEKPDARGFTMT